jgi:TetR/AcrR family transcriptional regulator, regulator of cefoperazone and chloramphenicol sensitivity
MSSAALPRAEDLTTRARIRDAAIGYFGTHGFRSATVRSIAGAAGVSPALVIHHFGSKDGLREACEAYVLGRIDDLSAEAAVRLGTSDLLDMVARRPEHAFLAPFLLKALGEGGEFGHRIYERLVTDLERYLAAAIAAGVVRPVDDVRSWAELMATFKLGAQLLAGYVAGPDVPPDRALVAAADRLTIPALELLTFGMFTTTDYLDAFRQQGAPERTAAPTGLVTGRAGEGRMR